MKTSEISASPIYEIASEAKIAGRRPIKVILHEIFPDDSRYQDNGISWNEVFVKANLGSVAGMSIVVEFLTEDRDTPYGHGMTAIREEDDLPLFEEATMVGHFDRAYIDDVEVEGSLRRVLVAEGTLDEMRYPRFVAWLRENMAKSTVKGSVEIVGKTENNKRIIYSGGWKEKGRVPQSYDYSGYAILGIAPADEAAIVMELNNRKTNKEDEATMDEKSKNELVAALTNAVSTAVSEANSKWDEYWAKVEAKEAEISQLRADIAAKEAEIAQLRADMDAAEAAKSAAEAGLAEANAARESAAQKLAEANSKIDALEKKAAVEELNAALAPYTEEQRAVAQDDIDAFNADPGSVEINAIVGKICVEMVRAARQARQAEINSADGIDIFGIADDVKPDGGSDGGETDIF